MTKVTVDTFNETMFSGEPIEMITHDKTNMMDVFIPGYFKAKVRYTITKQDAFQLLNNVSVMTYTEVREHLNQLEA